MAVSTRLGLIFLVSGLFLWCFNIFMTIESRRQPALPDAKSRSSSGISPTLPPPSEAVEVGNIKDSIFVSIASYRDVYCSNTLETLFGRAKYPEKVKVGLVQQNNPANPAEECLIQDPALRRWQRNVWTLTVPYWESRGPTWARWIASRLWRNETYFMQIDAHSVFLQNWDEVAIGEVKRAPSKRPVLTAHPGAIPDEYSKGKVSPSDYNYAPYVCGYKVDGDRLPRFEGILAATTADELPWLVPFSGAGLIFGPAEWVRDAPFDPYADFLFSGEELLIAMRIWTAGWDLFTATKNLIFHNYNRVKNPSNLWADTPGWWNEQQESIKRLRHILHGCKNDNGEKIPCPNDPANLNRIYKHLDRFGAGRNRTLADYLKFAKLEWMETKEGLAVGTNMAGNNSPWCQRRLYGNSKVDWMTLEP